MSASVSRLLPGIIFLLVICRGLSAQSAPITSQSATDSPFVLTTAPAPIGESMPGRWQRLLGEFGNASRNRQSSREPDEIETDRDSFTPATTTAGLRRLIVESAYSFQDNRRFKETHSLPELLFRYGLTDKLEWRIGFNYEVGGAGNETSNSAAGDDLPAESRLERASRITYGLKLRVTDQSGWMPSSALILQGNSPTSGASTDTQLIGTYVLGWELANKWKLDSAFRYGSASEGTDRFSSWAPSIVLKAPVSERVNLHSEYFGIFSSDKAEAVTLHFISPGIHYLITPDLEVGIRVGWGLNDQSARFFSNVGFGVRF